MILILVFTSLHVYIDVLNDGCGYKSRLCS